MLSTAGVDPALLGAMEAEHHAMAEALAETDAAMSTFARSGSAADAAAARASVVRTRGVVDRHLVHEETELEPHLHEYEDTPEWNAVEKQLRRQPLGVAGPFFAWLTDGMAEEHRAYLRRTVPAPVVTLLAKVFGRRYYREVAPVWRTAS